MTATADFTGRVALVTGAGGGLGAAYCQWLAARGAAVVVNNRRHGDVSPAEAVARAIVARGGRAVADSHAIDGSGAPEAGMVQSAVDAFGRLDIVIANAGMPVTGTIEEVGLAGYRRAMDINFHATAAVILAAVPVMRANGYGRIVVTTSAMALFGGERGTAYAASKMALVGFARALGIELRQAGIRINTVSPHAYTKMSAEVIDERHAALMAPERVAPVVGWLASEACDRSGLILSVGAGRVRRAALVETPRDDDVSEDWWPDWSRFDDLAHATETRTSRGSSAALVPELREP